MAASLVGGAFLSSFLNVLFDKLSDDKFVNWIRGKKLDQDLRGMLENILNVVKAVLNDAEKKQITDNAFKRWLKNLQYAVYDADDLLDEVCTKAATQKDPSNFLSHIFNSQDRDMVVTTIEEVIARLEDITKYKDILDTVQNHLKDKLEGKKFLVVVDDVWSSNREGWESFLTPFECGSEGSHIIVTSRLDSVASMVKTNDIQHLNLSLLHEEDCWLVFAKHTFFPTESSDRSSLEIIGRKIVQKCKGLPLAVQTLGGLLRTKDHEREWIGVLNSEIWEFSKDESSILPALRISYYYLPST
ncbi:hypothetical protein AHAS_Ahas12G0228400 [Arachis hypogaea]